MHVSDYYISFFDLIILIPLGWSAYKGFVNGAIVEALSLSTLLLGIYAYIRIIEMPNRVVSKEVAQTLEYLPLVLFTISFVVITFLSNTVERFVGRVTDGVALPLPNRFFGIIFSIIKYMMIISGFLIFVDKLDEKYTLLAPEDTESSVLFSKIIRVAPTVFPYLNFDNIKNRRYITLVKKMKLQTTEGYIPIGPGIKNLAGYAGREEWTSYQSPSYRDNHDLIIVEVNIENQDDKLLKTGTFLFLLNKRKETVSLYSYSFNNKEREKRLGFEALKNGKFY